MEVSSKKVKRKKTITLPPDLDEELMEYIRKRAQEIIQREGRIPSETEIIEEVLRKGLEQVKGGREG